MKTYVLLAPTYALGAVLSGTFAGILFWGGFAERQTALLWILSAAAALFTWGFLFALGRGIARVRIAPDSVCLLNGIGRTMLRLTPDAEARAVSLVRTSDVELDGPTIAENTPARRVLGTLIRGVLALASKDLNGLSPSWGMEDFVVVSTSGDAKKRALLPDAYRWNRAAYRALAAWLNERGFTLNEAGAKLASDGSPVLGWVLLTVAIFTLCVLIGGVVYAYLSYAS